MPRVATQRVVALVVDAQILSNFSTLQDPGKTMGVNRLTVPGRSAMARGLHIALPEPATTPNMSIAHLRPETVYTAL